MFFHIKSERERATEKVRERKREKERKRYEINVFGVSE